MLKYRSPEELHVNLVNWISKQFSAIGVTKAVLGISGGIDSALLSVLLSEVLSPENVIGVIMPCHSLSLDEQLALELADKFRFQVKKVDLTQTYNTLISSINATDNISSSLALANIKPRLRMTTLYVIAQENNALVCGASNKDELMYGYFTKHGDSGVDILPLSDLLKGEVYSLSKYLGVIDKIIDRPPTAGLWDGQTDEEEMGISYNELDSFLLGLEIHDDIKRAKIEKAITLSVHKRRYPLMP